MRSVVAGLVAAAFSYLVFDFYLKTTAIEIVNSWAQNEAVSIQQGDILSAITKSQRILMSSDFIRGIGLYSKGDRGTHKLAEFGEAPDLTVAFDIDALEISTVGVFRYVVAFPIPERGDMVVVFGVAPKVAVWLFAVFSVLLIGIVLAVAYLTERAEQARLESQIRYVALARGAAHDIRGPLSAMRAVLSRPLTEASIQMLREVSERINSVADDLLDKSRSATKCEVSSGEAAILQTVHRAVVEKCAQIPADKKIEIEVKNRVTSPSLRVRCDEVSLVRILDNLIQNSIEAIDSEGRVDVFVSDERSHISIAVVDTGRGVPADILPHLFKDGGSFGKRAGNGLGLSQAKATIEGWKGTIRMFSREGVGTTVFISLPASVQTHG